MTRPGIQCGLQWLFALLLVVGNVYAADDWDEEKPWVEDTTRLPGPPDTAHLIEVQLGSNARHRIFIDPASISVGNDRVVRYTMVMQTAGGATNVVFEGIRCATLERRIYATGQANGAWHSAEGARWQPVNRNGHGNPYVLLIREVFCPNGLVVESPTKAVQLLRAGGRTVGY